MTRKGKIDAVIRGIDKGNTKLLAVRTRETKTSVNRAQ